MRAYGQKDPLNEYKREAFNLFNDLLTGLREQVVSLLATLQLRMEPPPMPEHAGADARDPRGSRAGHGAAATIRPSIPPIPTAAAWPRCRGRARRSRRVDPNDPSTWGKVSRNAPCPCGSGKKFKHCHGRV